MFEIIITTILSDCFSLHISSRFTSETIPHESSESLRVPQLPQDQRLTNLAFLTPHRLQIPQLPQDQRLTNLEFLTPHRLPAVLNVVLVVLNLTNQQIPISLKEQDKLNRLEQSLLQEFFKLTGLKHIPGYIYVLLKRRCFASFAESIRKLDN